MNILAPVSAGKPREGHQNQPPDRPDKGSMLGLDLVSVSIAGVQTGWGPFVAAFLTTSKWTQGEIGLALSVGTLAGIVSQIPAGYLVDRIANKKLACATATITISAGALLIALSPTQPLVLLAEAFHGFASCILTPGIAAISVILMGAAGVGERLGRNARFAAVGNGCTAAIMGLCGKLLPASAVFWLAAALGLPALYALSMIRLPQETHAADAIPGHNIHEPPKPRRTNPFSILADRRLLVFALAAVLFFLSNAAMLPLAAGEATLHSAGNANAIIAACIVVPQAIVALLSPWVGRAAERWGRRPLLLPRFRRAAAARAAACHVATAVPARAHPGAGRRQRRGVRRHAAAYRGRHRRALGAFHADHEHCQPGGRARRHDQHVCGWHDGGRFRFGDRVCRP